MQFDYKNFEKQNKMWKKFWALYTMIEIERNKPLLDQNFSNKSLSP